MLNVCNSSNFCQCAWNLKFTPPHWKVDLFALAHVYTKNPTWNLLYLFVKPTYHLKMDGWTTSFLLGPGPFSGAMLVSGRVDEFNYLIPQNFREAVFVFTTLGSHFYPQVHVKYHWLDLMIDGNAGYCYVQVDVGWTVNFDIFSPIGEILLLDELEVGESIYIYLKYCRLPRLRDKFPKSLTLWQTIIAGWKWTLARC